MIKPCDKCGNNRWKTKHKWMVTHFASDYECRKCGNIRIVPLQVRFEIGVSRSE